jgi:hypothetical protein
MGRQIQPGLRKWHFQLFRAPRIRTMKSAYLALRRDREVARKGTTVESFGQHRAIWSVSFRAVRQGLGVVGLSHLDLFYPKWNSRAHYATTPPRRHQHARQDSVRGPDKIFASEAAWSRNIIQDFLKRIFRDTAAAPSVVSPAFLNHETPPHGYAVVANEPGEIGVGQIQISRSGTTCHGIQPHFPRHGTRKELSERHQKLDARHLEITYPHLHTHIILEDPH